jgi:uncharacterized SAM-binding protein YcdF (DUF218 family)
MTGGADSQVMADAKALWNYRRLGMPVGTADIVLGLGSYDISVAHHAAELFKSGTARLLMFAGGTVQRDDLLKTPWNRAEAEVFRDVAIGRGIEADKILIEPLSTNTGENIRYSLDLLSAQAISFEKIAIVTKPNMERRVRATAAIYLAPESVAVTSPPATFEEYCLSKYDLATMINLMVGDLQRIRLYPKLGFQKEELVPREVVDSYHRLIGAGYTRHLIPDAAV